MLYIPLSSLKEEQDKNVLSQSITACECHQWVKDGVFLDCPSMPTTSFAIMFKWEWGEPSPSSSHYLLTAHLQKTNICHGDITANLA